MKKKLDDRIVNVITFQQKNKQTRQAEKGINSGQNRNGVPTCPVKIKIAFAKINFPPAVANNFFIQRGNGKAKNSPDHRSDNRAYHPACDWHSFNPFFFIHLFIQMKTGNRSKQIFFILMFSVINLLFQLLFCLFQFSLLLGLYSKNRSVRLFPHYSKGNPDGNSVLHSFPKQLFLSSYKTKNQARIGKMVIKLIPSNA